MAILAKWKITTKDKKGDYIYYSPGEIIDNIKSSEENRLIELGAAEKVQVLPETKSKEEK